MSLAHEKLKQKLAGERAGYGWRPRDGENRVFVLPAASSVIADLDSGGDHLYYEFNGHYFSTGTGPAEVSLCLRDLGQQCPACVASRMYKDSADPGLAEMAKRIRAVSHYVFNIIDLNATEKGVQRWAANWTCKNGIVEIAADDQWGFVYDPRNGVPFKIVLTPKNKSRSGWNSYAVKPEPNRLDVMPILESLEGGIAALDGIEDARMEAKTADEIRTLLNEMGFPQVGGSAPAYQTAPPRPPASGIAHPAATPPQPVAPQPVAPRPVAAPAAPAQPQQPTASAPQAVLPSTPNPGGGVHYDPGPTYVNPRLAPGADIPPGAPRCFSDYNPEVHQCTPCNFRTPCSMRFMGIAK